MDEMTKAGLVLEGGGMRGIYTGGALDRLLDENMLVEYVIGVSAGACQAFSYISRQKGRNLEIVEKYIGDHRYLSKRNLIFHGGIFGMDFAFKEIPETLLPMDYQTFHSTPQKFVIGATDCVSGEGVYFYNTEGADLLTACRASSSLPLLATPVDIHGRLYMDGGVADPIPLRKSMADGNRRNIVILTRNQGYRKIQARKSLWLMRKAYPKFKGLCDAYERRAEVYNSTLDFLEERERDGEVFVLRPVKPVVVSRTEKDVGKLRDFYWEGYKDMDDVMAKLKEWLAKP